VTGSAFCSFFPFPSVLFCEPPWIQRISFPFRQIEVRYFWVEESTLFPPPDFWTEDQSFSDCGRNNLPPPVPPPSEKYLYQDKDTGVFFPPPPCSSARLSFFFVGRDLSKSDGFFPLLRSSESLGHETHPASFLKIDGGCRLLSPFLLNSFCEGVGIPPNLRSSPSFLFLPPSTTADSCPRTRGTRIFLFFPSWDASPPC